MNKHSFHNNFPKQTTKAFTHKKLTYSHVFHIW